MKKNKDLELLLSIVGKHLEKETPGLVEEFKVESGLAFLHSSITADEVIKHFLGTAPDRWRLFLAKKILESQWELQELIRC